MTTPALTRRILITGATGQVGEALTRTLAPLGQIHAPHRAELDLTDPASIRTLMRSLEPAWVVNAAAYTAVDKAESEPDLARAINTTAPQVFAEEAARIGATLIHFSTDYVFDGTKPTPYVESDPTGPLNIYGATKLAGEQAIAASGVPHFIFRTSWVYGATGKNFLLTILRLARERPHLRIVGDQHGAPTWSHDLARLAAHTITYREAPGAPSGIYHATAADETTWHDFAAEAITQSRTLHPDAALATTEPIPTTDYPTPARRPVNSRLNCGKLATNLNFHFPDWRDSLTQVLNEFRT